MMDRHRISRTALATLLVVTLSTGVVTAGIRSTVPTADELTENTSFQWSAGADGATAAVSDSDTLATVGDHSLRFTTTGGFDTWMLAPSTQDASWDLTAVTGIAFWVYGDNPPTFQEGPWIRLHSAPGAYVELRSTNAALNAALDQWAHLAIPMAGNPDWARTEAGSPDLTNVDWIEIHADTWGMGFDMWIDGLTFDSTLPPPEGLRAYIGNGAVSLDWTAYPYEGPGFQGYLVYRDTNPVDDVTGLTPIAVLPDRNTTAWTDSSAVNGTPYHYALSVAFVDSTMTDPGAGVGPRTPRDETDLQVLSLARTPRYPRYCVHYSNYDITEPSGYGPYSVSAATGLCDGQDENTQRWPALGDPVTWTAKVRNRGTNDWIGTLSGVWRVDGAIIANTSDPVALSSGDTHAIDLVRTWDGLSHDVAFEITSPDDRAGNNVREVDTRSVPFLTYVDRTRLEEFREETADYPGATEDDFLDWLQLHVDRFNTLFENAGTAKRLHYDILEVLEDDDPDPAIDRSPFGIFPLRFFAGENSLRTTGYYDASEDLDYGLLHEMGHQLGLIDLYRMDVAPGNNHVAPVGFTAIPGLMNGGSHFISDHSAGAMTLWEDQAHGYFGQYLYSLPEEIVLRVLDRDGEPLSGATVRMYQKAARPGEGEIVADQVKAQGVTDALGQWVLPNVPVDSLLVPETPAGDRLEANPFGYVAVVGTNGLLFFEVEFDGIVDYAWLPITEANLAAWNGNGAQFVVDRQLQLGGTVLTVPPVDMTEANAASWLPWAADGIATASDDFTFFQAGAASVRMEATGGFDNSITYPGDQPASWDLSGADELVMWCYAENGNDFGFQNLSPWVFLHASGGSIELHPTSDVLNGAIGSWQEFHIPIAGDSVWTRTNTGSPDLAAVHSLEIHADTWGNGFVVWFDGVHFSPQPATATPEQQAAVAVSHPLLDLPRPNPAREDVLFSFQLQKTATVRLDVFDVTGRRTRTLVDGPVDSGAHAVHWDGRTEQGQRAAPGVYFVRLRTGSESTQRKVTVLR